MNAFNEGAFNEAAFNEVAFNEDAFNGGLFYDDVLNENGARPTLRPLLFVLSPVPISPPSASSSGGFR